MGKQTRSIDKHVDKLFLEARRFTPAFYGGGSLRYLGQLAPPPQMGTNLESNMVTINGIDQRFRGISDYTLWYSIGDGPEKAINPIVVEAKSRAPGVHCSTSDEQALGYMGWVHQERRLQPGRNATVYGIVTNGKEWRFVRINEEGKYSWNAESAGKGSEDGSVTSYAKIATLLGFIMGQAMIPSPYTTRLHSKEASREGDAPMLGV